LSVPSTLRIGHDAAFEPFAMVESGRATGLILDIVAEAMKRMKRDFAFAVLTLDEADSALADGKVDALAFKGDTAERRARMDFSAPIVVSGGPSNSSSIRRTSGRRSSPSAVAATCRVVRSSSGAPIAASSFWIRRLSAGCDR
jgi:hypothetical protein